MSNLFDTSNIDIDPWNDNSVSGKIKKKIATDILNNVIDDTKEKLNINHNLLDNFNENFNDDILENINMHIAGVSLDKDPTTTTTTLNNTSNTDMEPLSNDYSFEKFNFEKLISYQYLEFADFDLNELLKLLISLPARYPHKTTYPAALLYQCIRYADHKKNSKPLVEQLINLSFTKILSHITFTSTQLNQQSSNSNSNSNATANSGGDIVSLSYWLGCLSFLFYYLVKDQDFFKRYPSILQEFITTIQSIMIQLTSSIHSRILPTLDKTILAYTSIEDVKYTLYKNDWNFFKKRKQLNKENKDPKENKELKENNKENNNTETLPTDTASDSTENLSTNEDPTPRNSINTSIDQASTSSNFDASVINHLKPPSFEEQMKPSPIKIVQIFGALSYVLNLHDIHPIFKQQCLSMSINWFANSLFNIILKDKFKTINHHTKKMKLLSRSRAIQVRLNLSTLETWIINNDINIEKPLLIDDFMWQNYPYTLINDITNITNQNEFFQLKNITTYKPLKDNDYNYSTDNSLFYYQHFFKIAQFHLKPLFQLLQWLQVATTLKDEEELKNTINLLSSLTPAQLLKSIDKYNYELNEHKFKSSLRKKLSNLVKSKDNPSNFAKNSITYLPERIIPDLVLPTIQDLTNVYSPNLANSQKQISSNNNFINSNSNSNSNSPVPLQQSDFNGPLNNNSDDKIITEEDIYNYQPFLPAEIQDEVFEIHDNNLKKRQHNDYHANNTLQDEEDEDEETEDREGNDESADQDNDINDEDSNKEQIDEEHPENNNSTTNNNDNIGGDDYFKDFNLPSSSVNQPSWSSNTEIEANPW
ncbi:hypothetical protein TBLA_0C02510 [Henningerozyma blattae CBS 6284]|uniref:Dilute domain-containing protein n=1 Tax=Henningerozyma blattae (strain ATCC 34711 / CBS 6284 / DSM 70876 / NBRC 10599 / NRRL Y-10934 / UCD 77-7) TaxID=1071380 RepID=I2H109_HENB6|nr:hypothetical protein TBLA_0C02510 [Tetrapisispora blattae CBS 6284]CCH60061.1 hypothetical protein TBLA_0C02510 [Tetrapisispora blattae CBS 6284]